MTAGSPAAPRARASQRREDSWLSAYVRQTRAFGTALLFSVPLLLLYGVGLLLVGGREMNGADFLTGFVLSHLGYSGYLWFQLAVLLVALGTAVALARRKALHVRHFPLLLGESALYALSTGTLILFVMREAHVLGPANANYGVLDALVLSAGAGFYEELVFRLLLLGGVWMLLARGLSLPRWGAGAIAAALTSVVFSLAHYAGPETFQWYTFWYRLLAGLFFSLVFVTRGFAVAAWTHALYDVYVLVF